MQKTLGQYNRADHRARQIRPPHGPLSPQGIRRRCAARGAVRSGLQHPLAAADDRQERPGPFVVPVVGCGFAGYLAEIERIPQSETVARLRSVADPGLK